MEKRTKLSEEEIERYMKDLKDWRTERGSLIISNGASGESLVIGKTVDVLSRVFYILRTCFERAEVPLDVRRKIMEEATDIVCEVPDACDDERVSLLKPIGGTNK